MSSCLNLKPLEQFSPDFTWGPLWKGCWNFGLMVLCHWTRWLPCPYMVKLFFSRTKKALRLNLSIQMYSIRDSEFTKFIQIMILGWLLTFSRYGKICVLVAMAILKEVAWYLAVFIRWANCGPWASCFLFFPQNRIFDIQCKMPPLETVWMKCQSYLLGKIRKIFQYDVCWKFFPEC